MYRYDIINKIAKKIKAKDYLEIGVYDGKCFQNVEIENKDAVDPSPISDHTNFKITSDKFFEYLNPRKGYDIVFIDGLHLHKQSRKDFFNADMHLNPGGFILFHDTNPATFDHCQEQWILPEWNGTVYQTIIELRSEFSSYEIFTVDTDYGVTVVRKGYQDKLNLNLSNCMNFHFFNANRKEILNLISVEEFENWVSN
jgi:hypothetical protein